MKSFFRGLAGLVAFCFVLVIITVTFKVIGSLWFPKTAKGSSAGVVGVVDITGVILTSHTFLRDIQDALDNPSIKALVIRINSPGGLVAPSQEMYDAIIRADKKIPVVISMEALAASGGYYAALAGRKIFANAGTLTASIGVIMEFANTEKLYKWAKVERFTLKAGKFKDIGSPLRDMTKDERDLMNKMLADIHQQFRGAVKERRKLNDQQIEEYADGRVMTGSQAKAANLVDALGGFEEAAAEAKKLAKLPEKTEVRYPEARDGFLKKWILGDNESSQWDHWVKSWLETVPPVSRSGWQVLWLAPVR